MMGLGRRRGRRLRRRHRQWRGRRGNLRRLQQRRGGRLAGHRRGDRGEGLRGRVVGLESHDRASLVAAGADFGGERDFAQEVDLEVVGRVARAAVTEDLDPLPGVGGDEPGHVLDDAEDGDVELLEHRDRLAGVFERDLLGRGDDHGAGDRGLPGPSTSRRRWCRAGGRSAGNPPRPSRHRAAAGAPPSRSSGRARRRVRRPAAGSRARSRARRAARRGAGPARSAPGSRRAGRTSWADWGRSRRRRPVRHSRRRRRARRRGWRRWWICPRRPCSRRRR